MRILGYIGLMLMAGAGMVFGGHLILSGMDKPSSFNVHPSVTLGMLSIAGSGFIFFATCVNAIGTAQPGVSRGQEG